MSYFSVLQNSHFSRQLVLPGCTLLISCSTPPFSCTEAPRYFELVTLFTDFSCIRIVPSCISPPPVHNYSVFFQLTLRPYCSKAFLHSSNLHSASSLVFVHNTTSSANNIPLSAAISSYVFREYDKDRLGSDTYRYLKLFRFSTRCSDSCPANVVYIIVHTATYPFGMLGSLKHAQSLINCKSSSQINFD